MEQSEKKRRIGVEIRRLNCMLAQNMSAHVKAEGIDEVTLMHGWIIRYLYDNRNREVFQKDIEKYFKVSRSSVTGVIKVMEKKGYLRRESVEWDARLKRVILTDMGIHTHETIESLIDYLNTKTLEGISDEEVDIFLRVVHKLEDNLEKQKNEQTEGKEETDDPNFIEGSKRI